MLVAEWSKPSSAFSVCVCDVSRVLAALQLEELGERTSPLTEAVTAVERLLKAKTIVVQVRSAILLRGMETARLRDGWGGKDRKSVV